MPAIIGNRAHAKMALELEHSGRKTAKGWKRCGQGASRSAWLHEESGVVYKVERWRGDANNRAEYKNARACAKLEWERVRIPKVSGFAFAEGGRGNSKAFVIAMEYVKGKFGQDISKGSYKMARRELFEKGGFEDMHGMNFVVTSDRKIVPIDMGSIRHGSGWREPDDRLLNCGGGRVY